MTAAGQAKGYVVTVDDGKWPNSGSGLPVQSVYLWRELYASERVPVRFSWEKTGEPISIKLKKISVVIKRPSFRKDSMVPLNI